MSLNSIGFTPSLLVHWGGRWQSVNLVACLVSRVKLIRWVLNFRRADYLGLCASLSTVDWSSLLEVTDVDTACMHILIWCSIWHSHDLAIPNCATKLLQQNQAESSLTKHKNRNTQIIFQYLLLLVVLALFYYHCPNLSNLFIYPNVEGPVFNATNHRPIALLFKRILSDVLHSHTVNLFTENSTVSLEVDPQQ